MQKLTRIEPASGDPIVLVLMDELAEATGWDPACIFPEYTLVRDLEMTMEQVHRLAQRLSARLLGGRQLDCSQWATTTLREIVDQVRRMCASTQVGHSARF